MKIDANSYDVMICGSTLKSTWYCIQWVTPWGQSSDSTTTIVCPHPHLSSASIASIIVITSGLSLRCMHVPSVGLVPSDGIFLFHFTYTNESEADPDEGMSPADECTVIMCHLEWPLSIAGQSGQWVRLTRNSIRWVMSKLWEFNALHVPQMFNNLSTKWFIFLGETDF